MCNLSDQPCYNLVIYKTNQAVFLSSLELHSSSSDSCSTHRLGAVQHVAKPGWERDLRITEWGSVIWGRNNPQTTAWTENTPGLSRTQRQPGVWFPALKPHFALGSKGWMELRTGGWKKIIKVETKVIVNTKSACSIQRGISERFLSRGSSGKAGRSPVLHWGGLFCTRTGAEHEV